MKNVFLTILTLVSIVFSSTAQTKVGDATLPNTIQLKGESLQINGAGIREKLWFDLYACGLYLKGKNDNAANIVNGDKPMAIKLEILSSLVSKKKLIEAFRKGIDQSNEKKEVNRLDSKINLFLQLIKGEISTGEVFDIVYTPSAGLTLLRDNKQLGVIEGLDFKKLIFNIWLANNSVDSDLKNKLLGK